MSTAIEDPNSSSLVRTNLQDPLFVLSLWRSGSSLLYALLNQHSKIGLLYEGDLPHLHRFLRGRFRSGAWRERWEFWNQGPSRHGIAIESLPENVANVWEATRIVYQEVARRKQATIWGEKTPHWYDCAVRMADNFPDARFIFLWRDVNAVIESIQRAASTERFFKKAGFTERVLLGNEKLREACDVLLARGRTVHEVNYEDLTSNTSECMQRICLFLELPFEPRIATLEGADRSAISSGQLHAMVRADCIVSQKKQFETVQVAVRDKIARYICRWKQRYGDRWPKYPAELPQGTRRPSFLELCRDRITYRSLLYRDDAVAAMYTVMPIRLARVVRQRLQRNRSKTALLPISQ